MRETFMLKYAAFNYINEVVDKNKDKGNSWQKQPVQTHVDHALAHLAHGSEVEDLKNALTRVAMAIVVFEEEKEKKNEP